MAVLSPFNAGNVLMQAEQINTLRQNRDIREAQLTAQSNALDRQNQFRNALAAGDLTAASQIDPQGALQFQSNQQQFSAQRLAVARERAQTINQAASMVMGSKDPVQAARFVLPGLEQAGINLGISADDLTDPDAIREAAAQLQAQSQVFLEQGPLSASDLVQVQDPNTGQTVFAPASQAVGLAPGISPEDRAQLQVSQNNAARAQSNSDRTFERQLRQDVRATARNLRRDQGVDETVRNGSTFFESIALGTGAGDTAAVIALAKILDPTSVVREGEALVWNRSDGVFGRLQAAVASISSGDKLSEAARNSLAQVAVQSLGAARESYVAAATNQRAGFEGDVDTGFLDQQFSDPFAGIDMQIPASDVAGLDVGQSVTINGKTVTRTE